MAKASGAAAAVDGELVIMTNQTLGPIEGRLWGQFIELAGRCINGGVYDPASPLARPDGTRGDVFEATRELRPTHVRYPGGCAAAYWDWQELVAPRHRRPRAKWFSGASMPQGSAFGFPEFHQWATELGAEVYFTVNAHTQSPQQAAYLVEYLNSTAPTKWADLRREHGRAEPYGVKLFGLGNEIYGDWQPGSKTADEYVAWCKEAIKEMKLIDPGIEIVCCGLGRPGPEWDRKVLKGLIDRIDMISVHNYFGRPNFADNMSAYRIFEEMIRQVNQAVDEAMDTLLTRPKRPGLAIDEWNVWYRSKHCPEADLEEIYHYTDALTVASLLHVILRHTATVTLANISLLVNTAGLLFTRPDQMVKQTIYWPHKLYRDKHTGRAVATIVDGPTFAAKHERYFCGIVDVEKARDETLPTLLKFSDVPALDALTTIDESRRRMSVSVIQKLPDRPLTARLDFHGRTRPRNNRVQVHTLTTTGLEASNTFDHPHEVGLKSEAATVGETYTFPPASLTLLEFEV